MTEACNILVHENNIVKSHASYATRDLVYKRQAMLKQESHEQNYPVVTLRLALRLQAHLATKRAMSTTPDI